MGHLSTSEQPPADHDPFDRLREDAGDRTTAKAVGPKIS